MVSAIQPCDRYFCFIKLSIIVPWPPLHSHGCCKYKLIVLILYRLAYRQKLHKVKCTLKNQTDQSLLLLFLPISLLLFFFGYRTLKYVFYCLKILNGT